MQYRGPSFAGDSFSAPRFPDAPGQAQSGGPGFNNNAYNQGSQQQQRQTRPPSGYRLPYDHTSSLPALSAFGPAPAHDMDGSPVFFGSALFPNAVHPCKIAPHLVSGGGGGCRGVARVPYGGGEAEHEGRFDVLPFDPRTMELVRTQEGRIPPGRTPIRGGYEEGSGAWLYHALADHHGVKVPGKCAEHLGGANIAFGGGEVFIREYEILCWRD